MRILTFLLIFFFYTNVISEEINPYPCDKNATGKNYVWRNTLDSKGLFKRKDFDFKIGDKLMVEFDWHLYSVEKKNSSSGICIEYFTTHKNLNLGGQIGFETFLRCKKDNKIIMLTHKATFKDLKKEDGGLDHGPVTNSEINNLLNSIDAIIADSNNWKGSNKEKIT